MPPTLFIILRAGILTDRVTRAAVAVARRVAALAGLWLLLLQFGPFGLLLRAYCVCFRRPLQRVYWLLLFKLDCHLLLLWTELGDRLSQRLLLHGRYLWQCLSWYGCVWLHCSRFTRTAADQPMNEIFEPDD